MEEEQGSKKVRSLEIIDTTYCIHIESAGENIYQKYTELGEKIMFGLVITFREVRSSS